ncbi:MAG TPA: PEP-CTERM sorting domain-containing protein [candidate division Zixibacteria bacterium]|nr:PEP-CTERM sorting domain-containing protein [candidate division Zixibacteria bacterium]
MKRLQRFISGACGLSALALWLAGSVNALPTPQAPASNPNSKYTAHNHDPLTQQSGSKGENNAQPGGEMNANHFAGETSASSAPAAVPEPASGALVALGLAAAAALRRRRESKGS